MSRVTGKYMGVGDGDEEGKTRPHPAPLPCLVSGVNLERFSTMQYIRVVTKPY